ncbi:MAG TPA: AraC family transcriptional regulator, partial [Bdellovibrio sp.]
RLEKKRQVPFMRNSFAQRFFTLLEEHFRSEHEVAFYAKKLDMTAKALTMKLHRLTGKSARTLILERALLESKRLLAYSDLSIQQIADGLGYSDANYFARYFGAKVRKTPSTFRKQAKKLL